MLITIYFRDGSFKDYLYLKNRHYYDFYRVTQRSPAYKIHVHSHQFPPKGWATPTRPKIDPKGRVSKRKKTQPKRLLPVVDSDILKFI